jgi:KaiC/GvpD/RAD55 family RecA-like ATPase
MEADTGRLKNGIPGLDLIPGGGLEPGSLVILAGPSLSEIKTSSRYLDHPASSR